MEILENLITETDPPPEAWLLLGRAWHALGDYARALAAFNDYLALAPEAGEGYFFAGRACLALGLPGRAISFLKKALDREPGKPQIMAFLGTAYLKARRSAAAVELLTAAVEASPKSGRVYRAYLNALLVRGIRLCRQGNYDLGLQMLRFVWDNSPALAEGGAPGALLLRLEMARACRELGRLPEALEYYTAALELAPEDRHLRWARASILMALGRETEAGEELRRLSAAPGGGTPGKNIPWSSELVDFCMIRSFLEAGEWRSAAEAARDWLKREARSPRNPEGAALVHAFCAEALRELGDYPTAGNHLLRAVEARPRELEFRYAELRLCWEAGDGPALRKAVRGAAAAGADPRVVKTYAALAEARIAGDPRGMLTPLREAIHALGPRPDLMYALGEALLQTGLPELARGWYEKTRLLQPGHEKAWLGEIAALEAGGGTVEERGALYDAYLERWPDNLALRRERALFLVRSGRYAPAAVELERLLAWEPGNPTLRRVLAYAYRKTGRCREAAVFLKALLRERPRDVGLLLEYAGCLERAGGASYAEALLDKARVLFETSPEVFLAAGVLSFRQKKIEKAFDCLREAAALRPADPRPYRWMAAISRKLGETAAAARYEGLAAAAQAAQV